MVGYVIFFICTVDFTCLLFSLYMHLFSRFVPQAKERKRDKDTEEGEGEGKRQRQGESEEGNGEKEDLCEVIIPNCSLNFVFLFKSHLGREKTKRQCYHIRVLFCLVDFARLRLVGAELEILEDTWGLKQMESLSSVLAYQARLKVSAIMQFSSSLTAFAQNQVLKYQLKTITNFPHRTFTWLWGKLEMDF